VLKASSIINININNNIINNIIIIINILSVLYLLPLLQFFCSSFPF